MPVWHTAVRRFHSGPPFNYTTYDIYSFDLDTGLWSASPVSSLSTSPHEAGGGGTRIPFLALHSGSFVFIYKAWGIGDVDDYFATEWDGVTGHAWTAPVKCTTFSSVSNDESADLIGACVDNSDRVHLFIAGVVSIGVPPISIWDIIYTPGVGFGAPILVVADSGDDNTTHQSLSPIYKPDTDELLFAYIGHPAPFASFPNPVYVVRGTPSAAPGFSSTQIANDANYNERRSRVLFSPTQNYTTVRVVYPSGEDANFYPDKIKMAVDSGSGWTVSTIWDLASDPAPLPLGVALIGMDGPATATQSGSDIFVCTIADGDFQSGTVAYFQSVPTVPGEIVFNDQTVPFQLDEALSTMVGPVQNGSSLWVALRPNSDFPTSQTMGWFQSADGGATWTQADSANAPAFGADGGGAAQSVPVAFPLTASTLAITCGSPPDGQVGTAYSHDFSATTTGGTPPYGWTISAGSLPPGITLDSATGIASGTPTLAGTFAFTVEVTDADSNTATVDCSIAIVGGALGLACGSPPAGTVGTAYSHTLVTSGGVPPFAYTLVSGTLPPGLALGASDGSITGVPTTTGSFVFRVRVTDSLGSTADVTCSIVIAAAGGNCPDAPEYSS